jgi:hypothetical protein
MERTLILRLSNLKKGSETDKEKEELEVLDIESIAGGKG